MHTHVRYNQVLSCIAMYYYVLPVCQRWFVKLSILNSRSIPTLSSDPRHLEPLTTNHLLLLRSLVPLPHGLFMQGDLLSRHRWRQVQYLADVFRKRWSKEYPPLLHICQKWVRPQRNLPVGDVVLVASEIPHRNSWSLGTQVWQRQFQSRIVLDIIAWRVSFFALSAVVTTNNFFVPVLNSLNK